jgi:pimeloyl-ACP methyl ester carboxylesterase
MITSNFQDMGALHIAMYSLALVLTGALAGVIYQQLGTRTDAKRYPPPGRLVDLGTHRLHLFESGNGGRPTVILEAGLMSTVLSWSELQHELSRTFRVVSYDRAGMGWSDIGPMPRTATRIVEELHLLLERAAIPGPYILVGHSFGGLTMPLFAARFPEEVVGMVLVDPVVPAEWNPPSEQDRKLSTIGAKVCRRAALLSRIGVIRLVVLLLRCGLKTAAAYLVRLISRGTPADSGSVSSPWFSALPAKERAMASVFWVQPKFALTIASQLKNLPVSAASIARRDVFCEKKVMILTANSASDRRRNGHAAMAEQLPMGEQISAAKSGHWIMHEERELVIGAIRKVAEEAQAAQTTATTPVAAETRIHPPTF